MSACVVIPIKTTNERLQGKNTRPLGGKPLYAYLFGTVKKAAKVDAIYVDSSDDSILRIAAEWGFQTIKRPDFLNANNITGNELLAHIVQGLDYDIISQLHVTSPFLRAETIDRGITALEDDPSLDCSYAVVPRYNRFWFQNRPINHELNALKRTQDLEPVYEESDCYFVRRSSFQKYRARQCGRSHRFEITAIESVDIDTIVEFAQAEVLVQLGLSGI